MVTSVAVDVGPENSTPPAGIKEVCGCHAQMLTYGPMIEHTSIVSQVDVVEMFWAQTASLETNICEE